MPKIDPNDSSFDGGPGILGEGKHLAFIANIDIGNSSQKGTPFVEFEFECHDPESPSNGKSLRFQKFYITYGATWRFVNVCRAARPKGCPPVDTDDRDDLIRELRDRPLVITVEKIANPGYKDKLEVTDVEPISPVQEKRLRAAYNGNLVPPMEDGSAPPDEGAQGDGSFSDDEIPF